MCETCDCMHADGKKFGGLYMFEIIWYECPRKCRLSNRDQPYTTQSTIYHALIELKNNSLQFFLKTLTS